MEWEHAMRRREFITLLGGAAVTWPIPTAAQQQGMPVVGFLHAGSPEASADTLAAFRGGLAETGYVEGRNVSFAYRWADGNSEHLVGFAADLAKLHVAVIATPGNSRAGLLAKAATSTIPIVFSMGGDPV